MSSCLIKVWKAKVGWSNDPWPVFPKKPFTTFHLMQLVKEIDCTKANHFCISRVVGGNVRLRISAKIFSFSSKHTFWSLAFKNIFKFSKEHRLSCGHSIVEKFYVGCDCLLNVLQMGCQKISQIVLYLFQKKKTQSHKTTAVVKNSSLNLNKQILKFARFFFCVLFQIMMDKENKTCELSDCFSKKPHVILTERGSFFLLCIDVSLCQ